MAVPIRNQQPLQPAQNAARAAFNPPAPLGMAAAPTMMQSAQPEAEKGYIETAIAWLCDWAKWVYHKICSFFSKEAPEEIQEPIPPPEPIPPAPVPAFVAAFQEQVDLLNAFYALPDRVKTIICYQVGRSVAHFWNRKSYEEIGRREIETNPLVLLRFNSPDINQH